MAVARRKLPVPMSESESSLHAQHAGIERQLGALLAAARAGRWAEYRRLFAELREGTTQHMLYEEEALYPALGGAKVEEVRALAHQHAELRRHLETLGAAAPERDPAGCIAELQDLGKLLVSHHAAEMALDPQYATRRGPPLHAPGPAPIDLRGLEPPEPIVRIFQALERAPRAPLRVILPHEPVPLYGLLRERGFNWSGAPRPDGGYELLIERDV
jgi:hypothetical protein